MIRLAASVLAFSIISLARNPVPLNVKKLLESKYKDPVVTDVSAEPSFPVPGIKIFSVYERAYRNEDPLIPRQWIYNGNEIIEGTRILEVLKTIKYQPADIKQAEACARLILSLQHVYIDVHSVNVKKNDGCYSVIVTGKCRQSHPFYRQNDAVKCTYIITFGNNMYSIMPE